VTFRPKLTDAQRCMLRAIDDRPDAADEGWAEVELLFEYRRPRPMARFLFAATCLKVGDALRRKGLIDPNGDPRLTAAGIAELQFGRTEWTVDGRVV
jgi:hypothetical protein